MHIVLNSDASQEMIDAAKYFEEQQPGLGQNFLDELQDSFNLIITMPYAYPMVGKRTRKKILYRFPFNIIYAIEDDRIRVLAIAHQKRQPTYWSGRA